MTLEELAWKAVSGYIRRHSTDKFGYGECFTCGAELPTNQMDVGHCITGKHASTKFDPLNLAMQCRHCNGYKSGARVTFEAKLRDLHGDEVVDDLILRSNQIKKYTDKDYRAIIKRYAEKENEQV